MIDSNCCPGQGCSFLDHPDPVAASRTGENEKAAHFVGRQVLSHAARPFSRGREQLVVLQRLKKHKAEACLITFVEVFGKEPTSLASKLGKTTNTVIKACQGANEGIYCWIPGA